MKTETNPTIPTSITQAFVRILFFLVEIVPETNGRRAKSSHE
jgi:hypothetical protein